MPKRLINSSFPDSSKRAKKMLSAALRSDVYNSEQEVYNAQNWDVSSENEDFNSQDEVLDSESEASSQEEFFNPEIHVTPNRRPVATLPAIQRKSSTPLQPDEAPVFGNLYLFQSVAQQSALSAASPMAIAVAASITQTQTANFFNSPTTSGSTASSAPARLYFNPISLAMLRGLQSSPTGISL